MSRSNSNKRAKKRVETMTCIPCQVEPGMFSGEYLVTLHGFDPQSPNNKISIKLFADERDVRDIRGEPERHKPVKALLRVEVAAKKKGMVQVVFPQPAQPVGNSAFFEEKLLEAV